MVFVSSLAAIPTHWVASRVRWYFVGQSKQLHAQLEDVALLVVPNMMSLVCGELWCDSYIGHVRGRSSMRV